MGKYFYPHFSNLFGIFTHDLAKHFDIKWIHLNYVSWNVACFYQYRSEKGLASANTQSFVIVKRLRQCRTAK